MKEDQAMSSCPSKQRDHIIILGLGLLDFVGLNVLWQRGQGSVLAVLGLFSCGYPIVIKELQTLESSRSPILGGFFSIDATFDLMQTLMLFNHITWLLCGS